MKNRISLLMMAFLSAVLCSSCLTGCWGLSYCSHTYPYISAAEWNDMSYASLQEKDWAMATRTASTAILTDPGFISPYINRAWAYTEMGYPHKAIEDCNKALELDPNTGLAYNNRGFAYEKMGQTKEAKYDYEKACHLGLEIACNNFKAITGYSPLDIDSKVDQLIKESQAYFKDQNWDKVVRVASEILDLDPDNELAYAIRGGGYANKNMTNEAMKDCDSAIKINPDFGLAYNNRGYALETAGNKKEAIINYEMSCNLGLALGCENFKRLSGSN
jgi:tetratricopeptide (TPR) repeat protein